MTEADMEHLESQPSMMDYIISMLGALTFGGVGWSVGYGLVVGTQYGLLALGVSLPESGLLATMIQIGWVAFPILLGLIAAWRSYIRLIDME